MHKLPISCSFDWKILYFFIQMLRLMTRIDKLYLTQLILPLPSVVEQGFWNFALGSADSLILWD